VKPNTDAKNIGEMISAELVDIANRRGDVNFAPSESSKWVEECHRQKLFGICLSGGGIRSSTFALGVLQGLAERDLLPKADYLSTVSGGGYIGSWLQGVLYRLNLGPRGFDVLKPHVEGSPSSDPISFLRKYSDYLSPRAGLSLDGFVIPIIWLRNTLLNQVIIVSAFLTVFLLILVPASGVRYVASSDSYCLPLVSTVAAVFCAAIAVSFIGYNLSRIEQRQFDVGASPAFAAGKGTERVGILIVLPLFLAVVFLLPALISPHAVLVSVTGQLSGFFILWTLIAALQWGGGFVRCYLRQGHSKKYVAWLHVFWMSLSSAALMFFLFKEIHKLIVNWDPGSGLGSQNTITWGPPLYLIALMVGVTLLIGLMGRDFPDSSREWLARIAAFLSTFAILWMCLFAIAIFSPYWVVKIWIWKKAAVVSGATAWIATTVSSVVAGKSGKTGSVEKNTPNFSTTLDLIARYGPFVAIAGFLIGLAFGLQILLRTNYISQRGLFNQEFLGSYWTSFPYSLSTWIFPLILFLAVTVIFVLFSLRVNINEFSMHHFYKNRLVRCFLGASAAQKRVPDSFTGFDPQDDIALKDLRCDTVGGTVAPFPILNSTLTLTVGSELATQERKAVPWIFTPHFSGFIPEISAANRAVRAAGMSDNALVDTSKILGGGVQLGTAMAISGAALNPGSGFHSAPQTAFLMTLFGVRLGWWIGNPRNVNTYQRTGPRFALFCLGRELFGSLNDRSSYLNLSDGGNFENLGLYELVRRRCRYVIAVDAEEDPNYVFESLGGAVRKCREDFGVEIDINSRPIQPQHGLSSSHCVIGRIYYPTEENAQPGWLLYIKASMTGDEPADVEQYRGQHDDFPQQSTVQQFFLESQFESYRRLGLHEVRTTFSSVSELQLDKLFERLATRWELPPTAPKETVEFHANEYSMLMDKLASSEHLNVLDSEVLENFPDALGEKGYGRSAFFFRRQLLILMETIFSELHFGHPQSWNHPANAGWRRIFEYWARQDAIESVWKSQRLSFGKPFQNFFDDLIAGLPMAPPQRRI
jgi:hypothetical protein